MSSSSRPVPIGLPGQLSYNRPSTKQVSATHKAFILCFIYYGIDFNRDHHPDPPVTGDIKTERFKLDLRPYAKAASEILKMHHKVHIKEEDIFQYYYSVRDVYAEPIMTWDYSVIAGIMYGHIREEAEVKAIASLWEDTIPVALLSVKTKELLSSAQGEANSVSPNPVLRVWRHINKDPSLEPEKARDDPDLFEAVPTPPASPSDPVSQPAAAATDRIAEDQSNNPLQSSSG